MSRQVRMALPVRTSRFLASLGMTVLGAHALTAQQLDIRQVSPTSVRITLKPVSFTDPFPYTPALVEREYPKPAISVRTLDKPVRRTIGALTVEVRPNPI